LIFIGKGDEVITTPFTFFATAGSISRVGAKPVFVDIHPQTWNIDSNRIENAITSKTRAIIPVHLYGCPANMEEIMKLAKRYSLKVIEDGAQAIGASLSGISVGAWGDVGSLSFFPTKNLGAFGDGGMVVTSSREIAERVALLRVHGATAKYHHEEVGCNSRLDELQAALLNTKLKHLQRWTARRREIAKMYNSILTGYPEIRLPFEPPETYHVYHQYTIATEKRDQLQDYLANCGIGTSIYYPVPLHLQKVYGHLGYTQGDFPVAESACHQALSLPMFPELTDLEVEKTAQAVSQFIAEKH